MIIQIRGTSGSGKSTAMRQYMGDLDEWEKFYRPKRKKPEHYRRNNVIVLGHYESSCGGCDTIGSAKAVYDLIQELPHENCHIVCEGLLLSEDVKWSSQLPNLRCLFLITPLDVCLRQIEGRRQAAGNDKPLNPANTTNRVNVIERARVKLTTAGIQCRRCSVDQVPRLINMLVSEPCN